jgi:hypothetical protein
LLELFELVLLELLLLVLLDEFELVLLELFELVLLELLLLVLLDEFELVLLELLVATTIGARVEASAAPAGAGTASSVTNDQPPRAVRA